MWQWLARLLTGRTRTEQSGGESDVEPDPAQVRSRPGDPTGNGTFVGRVAGEDAGDVGISGAEARSTESPDAPAP